jgi:MoaA/NifB/PqqE/SkfB family radical SAM enzyme
MSDTIQLDQYTDSKQLRDHLRSIHRSEFPTDYRLRIAYNQDVINNPDLPGKYLSELIKQLASVDISPFFVVIQTGYHHVLRDLTQLADVYQYGPVTVEHTDINFCTTHEVTDTFCVDPWIHLYFNPQGQITPCCIADNQYPLGNYTTHPIDFNSKEIVKFRQQLLSGLPAPQCSTCYRKEKVGLPSYRQMLNQQFAHHISDNMSARVEPFKLRHVDVRLSNVCNLRCRMCSGKFSNRIAHEDYQIWGTTEYLQVSNSVQQEQKLFDLIQDQIENIEQFYFAGGEPLINETHYKILQLLIDHKKTNVAIKYNTNFSLLKFKQHDVLDYWKKFENISVGASIDLMGSAADYVRNGVEYSVIEKNYVELKAACPKVLFEIDSVLSLYNVTNLCDLQQHWIQQMGLDPSNMRFNTLVDPEYLSLQVLPGVFKQQAQTRIATHLNFLRSVSADALIKEWQQATNFMLQQDRSDLLVDMFRINDLRDQARNQVFEDYFPEYNTLRNYVV